MKAEQFYLEGWYTLEDLEAFIGLAKAAQETYLKALHKAMDSTRKDDEPGV